MTPYHHSNTNNSFQPRALGNNCASRSCSCLDKFICCMFLVTYRPAHLRKSQQHRSIKADSSQERMPTFPVLSIKVCKHHPASLLVPKKPTLPSICLQEDFSRGITYHTRKRDNAQGPHLHTSSLSTLQDLIFKVAQIVSTLYIKTEKSPNDTSNLPTHSPTLR